MSQVRRPFSHRIALIAAIVTLPAAVMAVPITMSPVGSVGGTTIWSSDNLSTLGLTEISSITIIDDDDGVGGSAGIFSGVDIDALFLDLDGDPLTTGDQIYASTFSFTAGTTRPTLDPTLLPNLAHPGPTFGSTNATTIDHATATLSTFDGVSVADVNVADGFLTLGDGGILIAHFDPSVLVGAKLFILTGDVGGQEQLGATVEVNAAPEPTTLALLGLGLGLLGITSRKRSA